MIKYSDNYEVKITADVGNSESLEVLLLSTNKTEIPASPDTGIKKYSILAIIFILIGSLALYFIFKNKSKFLSR